MPKNQFTQADFEESVRQRWLADNFEIAIKLIAWNRKMNAEIEKNKKEQQDQHNKQKLKALKQEQQQKADSSSTNTEQSPIKKTGAIPKRTKKCSAVKTKCSLKEQATVLQRTKWQIFKIFGVVLISCCLIGVILKLVVDQYQSPQNHEMVPSLNNIEERVVRGIVRLKSELFSDQNNAEIMSLQKCEKIIRCSRVNILPKKCCDHQAIEFLQGHKEQECIEILKKYGDKELASYTSCEEYGISSYQGIPTTDMVQKEEILSMGKVDSYLESIGITPSMGIIGEGSSAECVKKNISQIIKKENCDLGSICVKICIDSVLAVSR